MTTTLTAHEKALCIAALDHAAKELKEGIAASWRLKMPMPDGTPEIIRDMLALKDRLMAS